MRVEIVFNPALNRYQGCVGSFLVHFSITDENYLTLSAHKLIESEVIKMTTIGEF